MKRAGCDLEKQVNKISGTDTDSCNELNSLSSSF